MALQKDDIEQITLAVITAMKANSDLRHKEDHEFIKILRIREESKERLRQAILLHISKAGALGIISGVLYCVWLIFKQKILGT